jgi:hypothetical protein
MQATLGGGTIANIHQPVFIGPWKKLERELSQFLCFLRFY